MPATFVSNPPNRWHRRSRGSTTLRRGHFVTDADAGVPILPQQFGDTLKLVVEIAWGANLTAASSTWVWTDITRDVRVDDAVSITLGKANEATDTQPAGIKFSVDDSASKYSTSPLGPNWPNVQFNTPIRARIVNSGVSNSRFVGYATSFVPGWNVKGNVATASISASGILQRLGQGQVPSRSCLWYSVNNTAPSMWWPLEEGTGSAQGIPAVGSGTMSFFQGTTGLGGLAGSAQFGGDTSLAGADRELTLTAANAAPYMVATVDSAVSAACATSFTLSWYAKFTDDATQGANFLAYMSGSKVLDVSFTTSTTFLIWDETGATSSTATTADVFGQWHQWVLLVEKSGSNVVAILFKDSNAYLSATFTGVSMTGPIQFVFEAPFTSGSSLSLSHVTLHPSDATSSVFTTVNSSKGHPGETVTDRISRITSERGITSTVSGSSVQTMGPQTSGNTVDLLRQCEQVDGGVLYDGQAAGFSYLNRDHRENRAVALTVDATQILGAPTPVQDDQLIRNRWTISRTNGATGYVERATGATGSATVGLYEDSKTLNLPDDSTLFDQAGWRTNQGDVPSYRYPALTLALHATPALLSQWLACPVFSRVQLVNLHSVASQFATDAVDMVLEGYTETFTSTTWDVTANTSPFDPWRVDVLAADSGDTGEFLCRLDTDGATASAAAAGATSLTVTTPSGPLWTTTADDFPLYVTIGGLRITVTAITGSSSPQTFTVDGTTVLKAINSGDAVTVWDETVLGL